MLRGRYSRKRYWLWSLALLGFVPLMLFPLAAMNDPRGGDGALVVLALIAAPFLLLYAWLVIHRLHDLGRSGWWFALLGPLLIVMPILMFKESTDVYLRIEQTYEAQQAIKGYVMFMLFGSFTIFLGGFVLLGCLPGTTGPNAYGEDPRG